MISGRYRSGSQWLKIVPDINIQFGNKSILFRGFFYTRPGRDLKLSKYLSQSVRIDT